MRLVVLPMSTPPFAKLRNAALLTVLFGAAATVGASAPLMAGQGDTPETPRLSSAADAVSNEGGSSDASPVEKKKSSKTTKKSKKDSSGGSKKTKKDSKDSKGSKGKSGSKDSKGSKDVKPKSDGDASSSPELSGGFESAPLAGRTIDFEYDGRDKKSVALAYSGRVFVPDAVIAAGKPVPLVVFFHGLNKELVRHRWMGGGEEGDVRRIVLSLIESGDIPPVIVAGPGSIQPDAVSDGASFPYFDFDKFMALTKQSVNGLAEIDPNKIVVAGHSGAGCSERGGIVSAMHSSFVPHSIISMDTCMLMGLAETLSAAPASTNVVVTWQSASWDREFDVFKTTFKKGAEGHPASVGVLRTLDELPTNSHDATVGMTFKKYLPVLLH